LWQQQYDAHSRLSCLLCRHGDLARPCGDYAPGRSVPGGFSCHGNPHRRCRWSATLAWQVRLPEATNTGMVLLQQAHEDCSLLPHPSIVAWYSYRHSLATALLGSVRALAVVCAVVPPALRPRALPMRTAVTAPTQAPPSAGRRPCMELKGAEPFHILLWSRLIAWGDLFRVEMNLLMRS
jgi:hypothetical protein